ncbi:MAG: hypothetical protein WCJ75_13575, partial [Desulfomonile sp.]
KICIVIALGESASGQQHKRMEPQPLDKPGDGLIYGPPHEAEVYRWTFRQAHYRSRDNRVSIT